MGKRLIIINLIVILSALPGKAQEQTDFLVRKAAFAGTFYPAGKPELVSRLKELFREAEHALGNKDMLSQDVQTIIVPNAGYEYSGMVAAAGYSAISKNTRYRNIFLITSKQGKKFDGISVCQAAGYSTPLGEIKVNRHLTRTIDSLFAV